MSVLIKGMEMPKDCNKCPMTVEGYCRIIGYPNGDAMNKRYKPLWCPLVDLPTAEPRKGTWIDYCGGVKCDQCGFECDDTYYLGEANYCPNCGARMEENE